MLLDDLPHLKLAPREIATKHWSEFLGWGQQCQQPRVVLVRRHVFEGTVNQAGACAQLSHHVLHDRVAEHVLCDKHEVVGAMVRGGKAKPKRKNEPGADLDESAM